MFLPGPVVGLSPTSMPVVTLPSSGPSPGDAWVTYRHSIPGTEPDRLGEAPRAVPPLHHTAMRTADQLLTYGPGCAWRGTLGVDFCRPVGSSGFESLQVFGIKNLRAAVYIHPVLAASSRGWQNQRIYFFIQNARRVKVAPE